MSMGWEKQSTLSEPLEHLVSALAGFGAGGEVPSLEFLGVAASEGGRKIRHEVGEDLAFGSEVAFVGGDGNGHTIAHEILELLDPLFGPFVGVNVGEIKDDDGT